VTAHLVESTAVGVVLGGWLPTLFTAEMSGRTEDAEGALKKAPSVLQGFRSFPVNTGHMGDILYRGHR